MLDVQLGVDGDKLEKDFDVVGEFDAAPLRDGLLDGDHSGEPQCFLARFLELVAQVECGAFIWKYDRKVLVCKVIVAQDVVG